ncbi:MAG: sugar phosphate isomerase/epimerase family protein [Pirellulales bacterium]
MYKNLNAQALGISGWGSEVIELALSNGFKGLDLNLLDFAEQVASQGFAKASRLLVSARLKTGSFRLPVRWDDDDQFQADMKSLPQLAQIAHELDCTRAVTQIEPAHDRRPYHENFEFHRRRLAELAEALVPYKIRLGLEYLAPMSARGSQAYQFIQSFDEVVQLLRTISAPNLGLAFDVWHWHLSGGTLEALRALSVDKLIAVTLADADVDLTAATAQMESRRLPGESGAIDIPAVLTALAEMGYDGPVSPVPDRSQFGSTGRAQIVKQCGAALDSVWKAAGLTNSGKLATVKGA